MDGGPGGGVHSAVSADRPTALTCPRASWTAEMTGDERDRLRAALDGSERALLDALRGLDDDTTRGPSALPGWSRGHVLTHVARNAETITDALDAVRRGEIRAMYDGDLEARNAAIETGADRPALALLADIEGTSTGLQHALASLTDSEWAGHIKSPRDGSLLSVETVVGMRWQEVEIHRLDLDLGYRPADWPKAFVQHNLARQLDRLPQRAPGVPVPDLPPHDVLAWLYGRGAADLPDLPPWP